MPSNPFSWDRPGGNAYTGAPKDTCHNAVHGSNPDAYQQWNGWILVYSYNDLLCFCEKEWLLLTKTQMNFTYRRWERKEDILYGSIYIKLHNNHNRITCGRWTVMTGGPRWPSGPLWLLWLNKNSRYIACSCCENSTNCALMIYALSRMYGKL